MARLYPGAFAVLSIALLCVTTPMARHAYVDTRNVPVDRLSRNLEAQIAKDTKNVTLRINLARTHAMAYALKTAELPVANRDEQHGPYFSWETSGAIPFENRTSRSAEVMKAAQARLAIAIEKYRDALAVAPDDLVANLGYAWCLVQAGDTDKAIAALRRTIQLAWDIELRPHSAREGTRSLTEEAFTYLLPLLDRQRDAKEIATLRERIRAIDKVTQRWITPIAIPLEGGLSADDLRNEDDPVLFDADGSGVSKRWTWITPRAGWLVSDIHKEGRIRSGLQLFGSVTWWLFWNNGYEPLQALDDNGDGRLAGAELEGLSIWRDANSNGVSESGEVRPVSAWKIVALSTAFRYDSTDQDEIAFSPRGVTFSDGSTRATYDLILHRK